MTTKLCRTLWIVLALAAMPLAAMAQDLSEEPGTDRPGGDYDNFRTSQLTECKRACARDRRCQAYTFNSIESLCYLKDRVPGTSRDSRKVSGVKDGHDDGGGWSGGGGGRELSEERGIDYRGGDYDNFRAQDLRDCKSGCRRDRRCQAYVYNTGSRMCYLKDRVGSRERDGSKVAGVKGGRGGGDYEPEHHGDGDLTREPGFDYAGRDYTSFRSRSADSCRDECGRDRKCVAYTFSISNNMCYLKDGAGTRKRDPDKVTGTRRLY
jgi:PAN domain